MIISINFIAGCKTDSSITVYNSQNLQVAQITDESQLSEILKNWEKREVVLVKKMPSFDYKLVIVEGEQTSEWQYAINGYVTSTKKADTDIYKVEFSMINQALKVK